MMLLARASAINFVLPTVTACGAVSTGCVESSSFTCSVLSLAVPLVLVLLWLGLGVGCAIRIVPLVRIQVPLPAALLILARLRKRLHQHRQNIGRRDVLQRARDRFAELHIGVELRDQLPHERHVDRPRHDVNAVRAHVGFELDLADDRASPPRGRPLPSSPSVAAAPAGSARRCGRRECHRAES